MLPRRDGTDNQGKIVLLSFWKGKRWVSQLTFFLSILVKHLSKLYVPRGQKVLVQSSELVGWVAPRGQKTAPYGAETFHGGAARTDHWNCHWYDSNGTINIRPVIICPSFFLVVFSKKGAHKWDWFNVYIWNGLSTTLGQCSFFLILHLGYNQLFSIFKGIQATLKCWQALSQLYEHLILISSSPSTAAGGKVGVLAQSIATCNQLIRSSELPQWAGLDW